MTTGHRTSALLAVAALGLALAGSASAEAPTPVGVPLALPAPLVVPSAVLRAPEGCVAAGVVTSRVVTVNAVSVSFVRDGRFAGTRAVRSLTGDTTVLRTRVADGDRALHTVRVRVLFADGARPSALTLLHRFGRCPSGAAA